MTDTTDFRATRPLELALPSSTAARFASVLVIAICVIAARRWLQFTHPDVWVEDGTIVLPEFIKVGWIGLFLPLKGYFIFPAKLVSFLSLSLSFAHYALISTIIATIVQAAVVATIAIAPTFLRARVACALAVVFVPSGTEVFALPLYVFWWTSLLVLLALLWTSGRQWLRLLLLVIGAFSSPFIVILTPAFIIRAAIERHRVEYIASSVAILCAITQSAFYLRYPPPHHDAILMSLEHIQMIFAKYMGTPFVGIAPGASVLGVALTGFLLSGLYFTSARHRMPLLMIGLCIGAAIVTSIARVPATAPHPLLAGPRYFFFPLITTIWALIWLATQKTRWISTGAVAFLAIYVPMLAKDFFGVLQVPKQPWSEQVAACIASPSDYIFDIQYGLPQIKWHVKVASEDCRRLQSHSLSRS